jgi:hypothetical protein
MLSTIGRGVLEGGGLVISEASGVAVMASVGVTEGAAVGASIFGIGFVANVGGTDVEVTAQATEVAITMIRKMSLCLIMGYLLLA